MDKKGYRFSVGPWNIHEGADPFGPTVRDPIEFDRKLQSFKEIGFDEVQFHDDDAVPDLDNLSASEIRRQAVRLREQLVDLGLKAEFVAPRLWEHPKTIDGAFTANDPAIREYALERSRKAIDIANYLETDLIVLWLAREGTYLRESKDSVRATEQIVESIDDMLQYDSDIRIAVEPKPNEPMDLAFIPTMGHALALGFKTSSPARVGALMESAHAILAGLDPSDELGFALGFGKLFSVHLNDQNGLKFDQDRSFGSVDLRRAFNQARILDENSYWKIGTVGLDVKALRTQLPETATIHLRNSLELFLRMVDLSRSLDREKLDDLIEARDYEEIDRLILSHLMGIS